MRPVQGTTSGMVAGAYPSSPVLTSGDSSNVHWGFANPLANGAAMATLRNLPGEPLLRETYKRKVTPWAERAFASELINSATARSAKVFQRIQPLMDPDKGQGKTYAKWMNLGEGKMPLHQVLSRNGLRQFGQNAAANIASASVPKNFSVGQWARHTLVTENNPVASLRNGELGSAIGRGLGLGFLGFRTVKESVDTYKASQAQGDSTLETAKKTGVTFAKETVKNGVSWEVAGVAFAAGRALLPVTVFKVPVGGLAIGALASTLVTHGFEKVFDKLSPKETPLSAVPVSQMVRETTDPLVTDTTLQSDIQASQQWANQAMPASAPLNIMA